MCAQCKAWLKRRHPRIWRLLFRLMYPTAPLPLNLWLLNFFVQRVLGVNRDTPWMVHFTSRVATAKNVVIGKDVWVSFAVSGGCYIQGNNGICIGDYTIFAPNVCIISANHDPGNFARHLTERPISIGKHCWIGANAVLLPGITLGNHVIVGAGSVVTRSFPEKSVIAGAPARLIRTIP